MSEPRADWGKDLVKAVEAMRDELKSHKDETNTLTKELSVFRSEVETVFQLLPPKEMAARVNGLVTDLASFQSKVETLISVTRGSARILVVFLLGTIVTVIGGAMTLVSAVNAQKVETAHLAKQVERLEASLSQKPSSTSNSLEPTIKKLQTNVEEISDKLSYNKNDYIDNSIDPSFQFILVKKSYIRHEAGSPGAIHHFKTTLPNRSKIERYKRIFAQFPDVPTRTVISSVSEGLERFIPAPPTPYASQVVLGPRVVKIKVRPEGKDTFEISIEGVDQNSSSMIDRLIAALSSDDGEYITINLRFLVDM